MASLREQIKHLVNEIYNEVEHGECFYNDGMYIKFIETLNNLKELTTDYFIWNANNED